MKAARAALIACCVVAPLGAPFGEAAPGDPEPAILAPRAAESLLLDGAAAGARIVAVGDRGHVLTSDDGGRTWVQKATPLRSMLTGVHFHDARTGWAVGHDGAILRTGDGGETWDLVRWAPEEERPLLDVWFRDALHGIAVGAYGALLETTDGGASWVDRGLDATGRGARAEEDGDAPPEDDPYDLEDYGDEPLDVHLNRIARSAGGRLYLAAEAGFVYRSDDDGATWTELASPYEGSFFGALPLEGESVLLFGLRGHLYRSDDAGLSWEAIPTGTESMLTHGLRTADGRVIVVGLGGTVLQSDDGGRTFRDEPLASRQALAAAVEAGDGALVLLGEAGATRIAP